jgi:hypothetical protein
LCPDLNRDTGGSNLSPSADFFWVCRNSFQCLNRPSLRAPAHFFHLFSHHESSENANATAYLAFRRPQKCFRSKPAPLFCNKFLKFASPCFVVRSWLIVVRS